METVRISKTVAQNKYTDRRMAAYIGMCGSHSCELANVIECLFGKKLKLDKAEKRRWRQAIRDENHHSLDVKPPYITLNLESVHKIMNCDKRYKKCLLSFYAFLVSKAGYGTNLIQISYETIIKEHKIASNNIAKYIRDLEDLKVIVCSRTINFYKSQNCCNIYAPYEHRKELEEFNKRNKRKALDFHGRELSALATRLTKKPENWIKYPDNILIEMYEYAKKQKAQGRERNLSVLEKIPPIEKYINTFT